MPRVKLAEPKYPKMTALIFGYAENKDISMEKLAAMLGITQPTLRVRRRSPETFSVDELDKAVRRLGIPIDDFRAVFLK